MRKAFLVVLACAFSMTPADADIFRWDTGELIPGTEGITPGPGVQLDHRELPSALLSSIDLTGANFEASNLAISRLQNSTLTNANLTEANLTYANFYSATLTNANLTRANLTGAFLSSSTLTNAELTGANLTGTRLSSSTLTNANLTGAVVTGANFENTTSRGFTQGQLASTASYQAKDLRGIRLGGIDLTGWDFSEQNLTDAYLRDATLTNADLIGADTRGVVGADPSLAGATSHNTILPDGSIAGLDLAAGERLLVRDDDGVSDPPLQFSQATRPPIPVRVDDHLTMVTGGVLQLRFDADSWDSTISFAPGIAVTLGGTLELLYAADVDVATQVGRTLDLFDWTGVEPTGAFDVRSEYLWDARHLHTTGEVRLVGIGGLADYDQSGTVEQGDLDLVLLNWGTELADPAAAGWINDLPTGAIDQEELDAVLLNWGNSTNSIAAAERPRVVRRLPRCARVLDSASSRLGWGVLMRRLDSRTATTLRPRRVYPSGARGFALERRGRAHNAPTGVYPGGADGFPLKKARNRELRPHRGLSQ